MANRTPVIAGNWKMNTDLASGLELAKEILKLSDAINGVDKIVCPPFISIAEISRTLSGSTISVGSQNVSSNSNGAFTGEVSASMLNGIASHAIVGHSERRGLNGETSQRVAAKAISAANAGLTPILCIGEDIEVRKSGAAAQFVAEQLESSLHGFSAWDCNI
jgi:triosephosphate isomerase